MSSTVPAAIIDGPLRALSRCGRAWLRLAALSLIAALMTGCSAVRVAYNQAPDLAYWWLDGYFDFNDAQSLRTRDALDEWFAWHRRVELPQYAALLAQARERVAGPVTSDQACRWFDDVSQRFDAAFEHALPAMADVARRLTPEQLAHLERKYADINEELSDNYLQRDTEDRAKARLKRALDPIERVYGRLSTVQREQIAALALQTPFDAARWVAERRLRQQDTLQTLARLGREQATADQATAALRGLVQRSRVSPRDDYRAYQQRLIQFNCAFAANVHNLTTPEQRTDAAAQLKEWEDDARALAAKAAR